MILLQVKDLCKAYGVKEVFTGVSFVVHSGEKLGLIGANGAGKTTLMHCITGEEAADTGDIVKGDTSLGYLEQVPEYSGGTSLFNAVMEVYADLLSLRAKLRTLEEAMGSATGDELEKIMREYSSLTEQYERSGGFSCEAQVRRITSGLGFKESDLTRDINTFSGGEKTRASLARLLAREPDLLLLDEPTNHLDLNSVEWLEGYLKAYTGSVLLISHDRFFLDQVTNKTLELEHRRLEQYPGNYTRYFVLKEEKINAQTRAYEKQQKEIKETEEYINKYRAGIKAKQARGRQSQLDRLERLAKPAENAQITLNHNKLQAADSGNQVLEAKELSFGYPDKPVLKQVNFRIQKGDKIALIGPNGAGKTSLLKLITGTQQPSSGALQWGSRVKAGYYAQEHEDLDNSNRVIDELVQTFGLPESEARDYLGAFLFKGDDVFKQVANLSGGEKGRLSFLKVLLAKPNFLILDEPTNHLDIASKQVVEDYLDGYAGTVLVVSHDRYFLNKIVDKVFELEQGSITLYHGNYSYYHEKKAAARQELERPIEKKAKNNADNTPKLNKAKTRQMIAQLEQEIENMEERLSRLSGLLADPSTYQEEEQAKELVSEYKLLELKIPEHYCEWERLNELLAKN